MITTFDVYKSFRQAQSGFLGRPFKLPNDFDTFFAKMVQPTKDKIILLTTYFNTKWMNVDPDTYFNVGFELFGKNFSYNKFTNEKILLLYIEKDKNKKRSYILTKENFGKSKDFVTAYCSKRSMRQDISIYTQYSRVLENGIKAPIAHYLSNAIDRYFLTWLIMNGYLRLSDDDRVLIPLITENYWTYANEIKGTIVHYKL